LSRIDSRCLHAVELHDLAEDAWIFGPENFRKDLALLDCVTSGDLRSGIRLSNAPVLHLWLNLTTALRFAWLEVELRLCFSRRLLRGLPLSILSLLLFPKRQLGSLVERSGNLLNDGVGQRVSERVDGDLSKPNLASIGDRRHDHA